MTDKVVLQVPAKTEYARTVRLAAAELAARAGMDIDGIDDVRMAVEEAFVFACERAGDGVLAFTFDVTPGAIGLVVGPLTCADSNADGPDRGEKYATFILESICDEFEMSDSAGVCTLRLAKRSG